MCLLAEPQAGRVLVRSEGRNEQGAPGAAQRPASSAMAAVSVAVEARKPKQAWTSEGEVEAGAAIVVMRIVSRVSAAGWAQSHS